MRPWRGTGGQTYLLSNCQASPPLSPPRATPLHPSHRSHTRRCPSPRAELPHPQDPAGVLDRTGHPRRPREISVVWERAGMYEEQHVHWYGPNGWERGRRLAAQSRGVEGSRWTPQGDEGRTRFLRLGTVRLWKRGSRREGSVIPAWKGTHRHHQDRLVLVGECPCLAADRNPLYHRGSDACCRRTRKMEARHRPTWRTADKVDDCLRR